jgi:hypothetical protein
MAQNGFAVMFGFVLVAGFLSIAFTVKEAWRSIVAALSPPARSDAAPRIYSSTSRPVAELPRVAQRLVLRPLDEELPEAAILSPWSLQGQYRAEPQLAFTFA